MSCQHLQILLEEFSSYFVRPTKQRQTSPNGRACRIQNNGIIPLQEYPDKHFQGNPKPRKDSGSTACCLIYVVFWTFVPFSLKVFKASGYDLLVTRLFSSIRRS